MQEMMQCHKLGAISRGFGHEINKNRVVPALLFFLPLRATLQVLAIFGSRKPLCSVFSEDEFIVLDYCSREQVQAVQMDSWGVFQDTLPGLRDVTGSGYLLWLTLLQNSDNKRQEMLLSFSSELEKGQWVEALAPATSEVE